MWNDQVKFAFIATLRNPNPDLVRLAADGLSSNCNFGDLDAHYGLIQALESHEPAVKRAVALAIGRIGAPGAEDYLIAEFRADRGGDVYLTDGLVRAIERLGKRGIAKFIELSNSGVDKEIEHVVEAFCTLRTRPGVEALPDLLLNPHLHPGQRVALIKSFGNYLFDPPLGPDLLVKVLEQQANQPADVRKAGLQMLGLFGSAKSPQLVSLLLRWIDDPDPEMRLTVIQAVEQTKLVEAMPQLLKQIDDENRSPTELRGDRQGAAAVWRSGCRAAYAGRRSQ